jgi:hypothetical protein
MGFHQSHDHTPVTCAVQYSIFFNIVSHVMFSLHIRAKDVTGPICQCYCAAVVDGINQILSYGFLSVGGQYRHTIDRRNMTTILRCLIVRTLQATRQII